MSGHNIYKTGRLATVKAGRANSAKQGSEYKLPSNPKAAGSQGESISMNSSVHQLKHYQQIANSSPRVTQLKANRLPPKLASGIQSLSGLAMDDVKVHYNSSKPAQLNAHAYAQRTDIHLASGQEKHLPHEAWHVVQQKQGRVNPTMQMKGKVNINDDAGLEKEADEMGAKAIQFKGYFPQPLKNIAINSSLTAQLVLDEASRQELQTLEALPTQEDKILRNRATALYQKDPSSEERDRITLLKEKFSTPAKSAETKAAVPKVSQWSDPHFTEVAKALDLASTKLYSTASSVGAIQHRALLEIEPDELPEKGIKAFTTVPVREYHPGKSGVREWVALYHALKETQANANIVHVIRFFFEDQGKSIPIVISTHNYGGRPDYLVHDANATLRMEKGEVMTAKDAPEEHRVSYASFTKKLNEIKRKGHVNDATIAKVMLNIVKNPGGKAPTGVPHEHLQVFTELVATWMLAESVRHRSAMISAIQELKLISQGHITFEQSLGKDDQGGTHPMSQGKSLKQGIQAEESEREVGQGKTPIHVPGKPTQKQVAQFGGSDPKKLLHELFEEYMPLVNKILTLQELEEGLVKKGK